MGKMDGTLDEFFNEIDEISPPQPGKKESHLEPGSDWQECFDESTGYSYYWNVKTDQVSWEIPKDYKAPTKIYRIQDNLEKPAKTVKMVPLPQKEKKLTSLVAAYDCDPKPPKEISNGGSDSDGDCSDLLTKLQRRAKELQQLGGDIPEAVKEIVEPEPKADSTGFSLLANYGDSDDEVEEEEQKKVEAPKVSHSTLFPIQPTIDVEQFVEPKPAEPLQEDEALLDAKAFQRKRRIEIEVPDRIVIKPDTAKKEYIGFKSGGVMLGTVEAPAAAETVATKPPDGDVDDKALLEKVNESKETLGEKLQFLSEGREPASPVQIMMIQLETLYQAMKAGSLKTSYLHQWLRNTCSELVKLEKDAAPQGWLLQWDRSHKRYYYRNRHTGDSQWEYPQPDTVIVDEAMDISTTPPPPPASPPSPPAWAEVEDVLPPSPPKIACPRTPPAPSITDDLKKRKLSVETELPLEPTPMENDSSLEPPDSTTTSSEQHANNDLGTELSSFYSDIAALEAEVVTPAVAADSETVLSQSEMQEVPPKKKKKIKVKLVEGLSMKKKGVSQLVEKWKSVQKDY